jgi:hypothetical protein
MSTATPAPAKRAPKKEIEISTPKGGYKPIKLEKDPNSVKVFEIPSGGGIVCKIKSEVAVYDKVTGKVRQIRYCPGEPSIYKEEQSNNSRRSHIIFRNGMLIVPENQPNLAEFLLQHPDNQKNGGNLFQLVDNSRNVEEEVNKEFLMHDAVALVRNKESDEILSVAVSLGIDIKQKMIDIRRELLKEAKARPEAFIAMFDDPRVKTRSAVIQANDFQIISCKPDGVYWFDSGRLILSVPAGQDPTDIMVRYCLTEKGVSVYEELVARLEKLS